MDFFEELLKVYQEPDPNPYLFQVGQVVRVQKKVVDDGQTPKFWAGGKAIVESRSCTGIHKEHWYKIRHANGILDSFREDELDWRYARKEKTQ